MRSSSKAPYTIAAQRPEFDLADVFVILGRES